MAPDREVELLARKQGTLRERARRKLTLVAKARTMRAYRRLFLDADGELTHAAALVLADLAAAAQLGVVRPGADAAELNFREGRRAMVLHLFARFDRANLERLARKMREAAHDRSDEPTRAAG